jgi:hypothetical protein
VTGNLEEAEGKALARRTGSGYEAAQWGRAARIIKVRNLRGTPWRRSDRHKRSVRVGAKPESLNMDTERLLSASDAMSWREIHGRSIWISGKAHLYQTLEGLDVNSEDARGKVALR